MLEAISVCVEQTHCVGNAVIAVAGEIVSEFARMPWSIRVSAMSMKSFSPLALIFVSAALLQARAQDGSSRVPMAPSDHAAGKLRVMTYNILGGRNTDGKRDLTRIAEVIKALNPDLVAMQEVDVKTTRIKGVDVPAELAKLTGMHAAFASAMPFAGGDYGDAVLSKFPIKKQTGYTLPSTAGHEPRVAVAVEFVLPNAAKPLVFIATHLDHTDANENRLLQIKELNDSFSAPNLPGPAILAGDFNTGTETEEMKLLAKSWTSTWPADKLGFTYPSDKPSSKIDHIVVQPKGGWNVLKTFVGNEAFPGDKSWAELLQKTSDHLPLVVELALDVSKN
jgi:endonuclease/exonuclease/phosphatase family metal-dependent hydrolase